MRVVMLHTQGFLPADISVPTARVYCDKWNYCFDCHNKLIRPGWIPSWNKILAVEMAMELTHWGDWVAWIDADILILRQDVALESFVNEDKELIISTDIGGICTGFFLIRKSLTMVEFVKNVKCHYCEKRPWEQAAIRSAIESSGYLKKITGHIPSSIIQCPHATFNPHAFAMHYWSYGHGVETTRELMLLTIENGWTEKILALSMTKWLPEDRLSG